MAIIPRPAIWFTGIQESFFKEGWENDKHFFIEQENPYPCIIAGADLYCETTNE